MGEVKRLYRSRKNRIIAGICGGIGEYLGIDPTWIRLAWIFFVFFYGVGVLAYLIAWLIIPERPLEEELKEKEVLEKKEENKVLLWIGLTLILGGTLLLLNNLGILGIQIWPILMIVAGVVLVVKQRKEQKL